MVDHNTDPTDIEEAYDENREEAEQEAVEKPNGDQTSVPTNGGRTGKASSLTGLVDTTLDSQNERETTARETINQWESNASSETDDVVSTYEDLKSDVGDAFEWGLTVDTKAGDLVDDLTHEEDLGVRDYAERQSEQIEGLSGTVRRFGNMIQELDGNVQDLESDIEGLEDDRQERYEEINTQIAQMDDAEFGDLTPAEYAQSEENSVDREVDSSIEELEAQIDDLESKKERYRQPKKTAADERETRRDETQQVYNEFAGRAETAVSENVGRLKESLSVLGELETQQLMHEDKSVDDGAIDQRQDDQAQARTETALVYVSEALEEIDQIESAVEDHYRVKSALSSPADVDTRELQSMYGDLVNTGEIEADLEDDEYGTEALRQGVLEVAQSIVDDGYDSVRELREIADEQASY